MKDRGKAVEVFSNNNATEFFQDYRCSSSDFIPCKKHPLSSSVGICAYCLKDRLVKLVCSDCGEQRLSSCSCSDLSSSNRNSCTVEVGSVGRVSFLIENEKKDEFLNPQIETEKHAAAAEDVILLKRSNSSCVEIKKKNGLWRIGRLFKKTKTEISRSSNNKDCGKSSVGACEEKRDLWVIDYMGVSRSRSLCSFRGLGLFGSASEDGGDVMSCYSGARSSISAARSSSVNAGLLFDPERRSGFSEAEPRKSGFDSDLKRDSSVVESEFGSDFNRSNTAANRRVFSLKESYFTAGEDSGFIDLKFDLSTDSNSAFGSMRGCGGGGGGFVSSDRQCGDGMLKHGGSCRITVNERGFKRSRKSFRGWRWIFKHHPNWITGRKKDEEDQVTANP